MDRENSGNERIAEFKKAVGGKDMTVKLTKVYDFEGEKVSEIDFSGIDEITAKDMIKINKILIGRNQVEILPESSMPYALAMASTCTLYPIEFYEMLKPRDAIRVKNFVVGFINGAESD